MLVCDPRHARAVLQTEIYVRTTPDDQAVTTRVDDLLGAQANPENPSQVIVSQPSDGAVGVANIMIISVLERRQEIGLRRALGATRGQIRAQFLAEAIICPWPAAWPAPPPAPPSPPGTPAPTTTPSSSPSTPGQAAWPPPSSLAPSPACCPPSAPPVSTQALWTL